MTHVWIVQCLCPDRHAILAAADEARDAAEAEDIRERLRGTVSDLIGSGILNPWCGLCGARQDTWTYDLGRTRFRSLDEATPELRRQEEQQAAVRAAWGDLHRAKPQ